MFFKSDTILVNILILVSVRGSPDVAEWTGAGEKSNVLVEQCQESDTKCTNGTCYRKIDMCDGWKDCNDGTDENADVCEEFDITKFECANGRFIDVYQVCDGNRDCNDNSDEDDGLCYDKSAEDCKLPISSNLRVTCEFKGTPVACEFKAKAYTNIKIFCNVGYVPIDDDEWVDRNKCRSSGRWMYKLPRCTFGCGTSIIDGSYPWNVIIFERLKEGYNRSCHGTLITPFHVLTDYRCSYTKPGETLYEERLKVGLEYYNENSEFYNCSNLHPLLINVIFGEVIEDNRTILFGNYFEEDGFPVDTRMDHSYMRNRNFKTTSLEIKTHIDLVHFRPACVDLDNKLEIKSNMTGKVVIKFYYMGNLTAGYEYADFHILTHQDCQKYLDGLSFDNKEILNSGSQQLQPEEFCAFHDRCGPNCTRSLPIILAGSGISFRINEKYYIIGVYVGTIDSQDKDGKNIDVYVFSDVRADKPGDRPNFFLNVATGSVRYFRDQFFVDRYQDDWKMRCFVPYSLGGVYTDGPCNTTRIRNCTEYSTHSALTEEALMFIYCKENYTLIGQYDYMVCRNGKWIPDDISCVRLCDPLTDVPTVKAQCYYQGRNTSCSKKVVAETVAVSTCEAGGLVKDLTTYNNTCLHSGQWRDGPEVVEIFCIDLCGTLKSERALVQDGDEANSTYHPWNAGLYYQDEDYHFIHICGGTLISRYAVLTAAHCVQDANGVRFDASELRVGLAKFYRVFNHSLDLQAQYIEVENIYVPNFYDGPPSAYVADIAILELKEAADLNELVVPACIDTSHQFFLKDNFTGSVVGWGLNSTDEYAKQTDTLFKADLPYLNRLECLKRSKHDFNLTVRLTADKFCASHFKDGMPIVRRGDSGSGLTFKFDSLYYVYGIVSIQANNLTTMFTNVTYTVHLEFINKVLHQISDKKKSNKIIDSEVR